MKAVCIMRLFAMRHWLALFAAAALAPIAAEGVAPIPISSLDDLRKIRHDGPYMLSAKYELVCDIDASASRDSAFEPIGDNRHPFIGNFSGRGGNVFVIRNLYINKPNMGHVGLFGVVGYGAEVSNVGVLADSIVGNYAVGVLAGSNNGRLADCYAGGVVVAAGRSESNAGGLVGVNSGGISRSYSMAAVAGRENVGGLAGLLLAPSGEVSQCFAVGAVSGSDFAGGLVGQAFGGRVEKSFSVGRVAGKGANSVVGGLIGRDFGGAPTWNDRGVFEANGVSGYVGAVSVSASYWDVEASGQRVSAGGTGKGGAEMMLRRTFNGWDFDGVWSIVDGACYPQLVKIPIYTYRLDYSVDMEECGRLAVLYGRGSVGLYGYGASVAVGGHVEVVAEPWGGCRFLGWSDGNVEARRFDVALRDFAVAAMFERAAAPRRAYRYAAGVGGALRAPGFSGTVPNVDTAVAGGRGPTVAAVPDSGYRFARWSDGVRGIARSDTVPPPGGVVKAVFVEDNRPIVKITSYQSLYLIGRYELYPLSGSYELASDIEILASDHFLPIGSAGAPFTGVFRGNGHKISGLRLYGAGNDFAGLFACAENANISGVYLEGAIDGGENAGMLAGMCINAAIDSCGVGGTVRGVGGVGGLVGRSVGSLITRSYSTARVDGLGPEVGGLVGSAAGSFLAQCYSSGGVSGGAGFAGGLAGRGSGGLAQYCYSVGSVSGDGVTGGFIGEAGGGIRIFQCYSAGYVAAAGIAAGGFAGTLGAADGNGEAVSIVDCYWDAERSGKGASAGGRGRGTAEMSRQGAYVGWDFEGVWETGDVGYPWLRGLVPELPPGVAFGPARVAVAAGPVAKPLMRVAGGALFVNARPGVSMQIRLVDMRGRIAARYDAVGTAKLALDNVPSGRYIAEAIERGRRVGAAQVRVLK
jgi:hypothetical protein